MLTFPNDSAVAVIVLHEIYGINPRMRDVCAGYHALGYTVYCPDMLGTGSAFSYDQRDAAYAYFMANTGFGVAETIGNLAAVLKPRHDRLFLIGYSVGATIAWLAASAAACDAIVCHYGTRIREYAASPPSCPALLILAKEDTAFPVLRAEECFRGAPAVTLAVFAGGHGFCDGYGPAHHSESAIAAGKLARRFLREKTP